MPVCDNDVPSSCNIGISVTDLKNDDMICNRPSRWLACLTHFRSELEEILKKIRIDLSSNVGAEQPADPRDMPFHVAGERNSSASMHIRDLPSESA